MSLSSLTSFTDDKCVNRVSFNKLRHLLNDCLSWCWLLNALRAFLYLYQQNFAMICGKFWDIQWRILLIYHLQLSLSSLALKRLWLNLHWRNHTLIQNLLIIINQSLTIHLLLNAARVVSEHLSGHVLCLTVISFILSACFQGLFLQWNCSQMLLLLDLTTVFDIINLYNYNKDWALSVWGLHFLHFLT